MQIDRGRGLFTCSHCGTQQEAPAALEYIELLDETSSRCPLCATRLAAARLEGYPLRCCGRCFGLLIEMSWFVSVIDALRAHQRPALQATLPRRQAPSDHLVTCPSCGQPMLSHLYGGPGNVVIDSCEACQLNWLDPGELRRIAVAPDWRGDDSD